MTGSDHLLHVQGVSKEFDSAGTAQVVLRNIDLEVDAGDTVAIIGPSGCGKSTLLNIIGALDRPTSGKVLFEGRDVHAMRHADSAEYRNRCIGFVFQLHHLLPQCTVLENVLVPTLVNPLAGDARARAMKLLERVGLTDRAQYRPGVLSGGERQRVAVARALENQPKLLLADEPTGSLNQEGAESLVELLCELNREFGMALIIVTHSIAVAKSMNRIYELTGGVIEASAAAATE